MVVQNWNVLEGGGLTMMMMCRFFDGCEFKSALKQCEIYVEWKYRKIIPKR